MKSALSRRIPRKAFTLTELLVVIACALLLLLLVLSTLANGRTQSAKVGCLANLRRLQVGAEMYRVENIDTLMPNAVTGQPISQVWAGGNENWGNSAANVDPAFYTNAIMMKYLQNDLSLLRCPGDVVPSANGPRIRSYSMNGQMGALYIASLASQINPFFRFYTKGSDLVCPTPANAFVFLDENPCSLNDGYFQLSLSTPGYPDVPAAYLDGGCGFSFADGHAAYRKWTWRTSDPASGILNAPYVYGQTTSGIWGSTGVDFDWRWLRNQAACPK